MDKEVIWRCEGCVQEDGPTGCSYAKFDDNREKQHRQNNMARKQHTTITRKSVMDQQGSIQMHDTCSRTGQPIGKVLHVPQQVEEFINTILQGEIVYSHPDGHCLRRSIAKIYNLHPGVVIQYMRKKCAKLMQAQTYMHCEQNQTWYETVQQRPKEWDALRNNIPDTCVQQEWGNSSEIQLWSIITGEVITVLDIDQQQAVTYLPDLEANDMAHSRKRKRDRVWKYARATPLHLVGGEHQKYVDQGDKTPRYMIYGQAHYSGIIYDHRAKEEEKASGGGSGIGRQDEE
ncbi:MAG TPA: hypothetical protein EYO58_01200, partial [Flavobacteriales bacterium]|nr:hypothetical protein [Flavobacteriales bacterium]